MATFFCSLDDLRTLNLGNLWAGAAFEVATRGERLPRLPHLHPPHLRAPWINFPHRPRHADDDRDVRAACYCSYHGVTAGVCCNSTGRCSLCFRPVGLVLDTPWRSLLRIPIRLVRNFQFDPTAVRNCTLSCMYVCMSPYHLRCPRCRKSSSPPSLPVLHRDLELSPSELCIPTHTHYGGRCAFSI